MIQVDAIPLEFNGIRLEPLTPSHADALRAAASDGELWNVRVAFAVVGLATGAVMGTTSYHDIVPALDRLEIGWKLQQHATPC